MDDVSAGPGLAERDRLAALVEAVARNRDRQAFAELFRRFAPRLKAFLQKQGVTAGQAEDLVQEAMLQVWRRAETYDRRQSTVVTWVYTIARNKRIDALRREKRPELDPDDPLLAPEAPDAPDRQYDAAEVEARLRAAVRELPAEQREMVTVAFYEDRTHREIATARGLPLGTVKGRIRLALDKLRKSLEEP